MATPVSTLRHGHCLHKLHGPGRFYHFCHFLARASEFVRLPRLSGATVFFSSWFGHVWRVLERLLEVLILELQWSWGVGFRRDRRSVPGYATC